MSRRVKILGEGGLEPLEPLKLGAYAPCSAARSKSISHDKDDDDDDVVNGGVIE